MYRMLWQESSFLIYARLDYVDKIVYEGDDVIILFNIRNVGVRLVNLQTTLDNFC